jgi:hypothetical protein
LTKGNEALNKKRKKVYFSALGFLQYSGRKNPEASHHSYHAASTAEGLYSSAIGSLTSAMTSPIQSSGEKKESHRNERRKRMKLEWREGEERPFF